MSRFISEQNYKTRKRQINARIAEAKEAHAEVALASELGEVGQEALEQSRAQVTSLQDSLSALESAFRRSQAAEEAAEKAETDRKHRDVIATVNRLVAARRSAAKDLAKLAAAIDDAAARFREATDQIGRTALPLLNRKRGLRPAEGLTLENLIPFRSADGTISQLKLEIRLPGDRDILEFVDRANDSIRNTVADLEPEDEPEMEAA